MMRSIQLKASLVATVTAVLAAVGPRALSAHPGHEPFSSGAFAATFHAVFGVAPWVAATIALVVLGGWLRHVSHQRGTSKG